MYDAGSVSGTPFYGVWLNTGYRPATSDREQAEAWARWARLWLAGWAEWQGRPWLAEEQQAAAWQREWANDYEDAYVAADGNRYSSVNEHDLVWKGDE